MNSLFSFSIQTNISNSLYVSFIIPLFSRTYSFIIRLYHLFLNITTILLYFVKKRVFIYSLTINPHGMGLVCSKLSQLIGWFIILLSITKALELPPSKLAAL